MLFSVTFFLCPLLNESLGNTIYFTLKEKELHCCCLTFYGNVFKTRLFLISFNTFYL